MCLTKEIFLLGGLKFINFVTKSVLAFFSKKDYANILFCFFNCIFKGAWSDLSDDSNDASSPEKSWFQISVKSVKPFGRMKKLRILQLPIPYCATCVSLIMVTILP